MAFWGEINFFEVYIFVFSILMKVKTLLLDQHFQSLCFKTNEDGMFSKHSPSCTPANNLLLLKFFIYFEHQLAYSICQNVSHLGRYL